MCGIAGIAHLRPEAPVCREQLRRMTARLRNRGPDGEGYFTDPGIGLGHTRLSIIDLEGGQQPIHNEDRSVWTVFNGEIFNYRELRSALEQRGHRFYTETDTEVIVHLYEEHGTDFVDHLNGQFAIALWDRRRRRLLLARDRPGILPLFFARDGDRLIFASVVKALLPALESSPRLDPAVLDQIMTFWSPVGPETIFEGVEQLSPGEMLAVEDGRIRRWRYWDWDFPPDGEHRIDRDDRLAEELLGLLGDATRLRLRADVPVGAYLSGGLDSSGITALIRMHGAGPLHTFSLGFEEAEVDESVHQSRVIDHLQVENTTEWCTNRRIAESFPATIWNTETPVLRTAPTPMGLLSARVRAEGYKVVLTGEGADEVLGGYDIFKEAKIRRFWAKDPGSSRRSALLKRLYPYLPLQQQQSQAYLEAFFGQSLDAPDAPFFSHLPRWTTTARLKAFFSSDLRAVLADDALERRHARLPRRFPTWHGFDRAQHLEARGLMDGYLLSSQGDRMLMAHSVEGRFPFLDHRLIEFANELHPKYRMRGLNEKYLLKRALGPYLPEQTVARPKQPYRAPDIAAFFGPNRDPPEYVRELMCETAIRRTGWFDPRGVGRLMKKIELGRAVGFKDNMAFIGILSTQLWHAFFIEGVRDAPGWAHSTTSNFSLDGPDAPNQAQKIRPRNVLVQ